VKTLGLISISNAKSNNKLHVILVGVLGIIYKDHTNLWQTSIWIAIRLKS
jgi:hypothetical protein